jgi:hypothetical protein
MSMPTAGVAVILGGVLSATHAVAGEPADWAVGMPTAPPSRLGRADNALSAAVVSMS